MRPELHSSRLGCLLLAAAFLLLPGIATAQMQAPLCNVAQAATHGCVLTAMDGPGSVGTGTDRTKVGRACASNFLRLVAVGDMRISTAKQNGGITEVSSVDYETLELIGYYGLFSRYCTVVRGN